MHRGGAPGNSVNASSSTPATNHSNNASLENYSAAVTSQQKRSSIHSTSSKESAQSQETVPTTTTTTTPARIPSATNDREAISPASSAANSVSNRGSPSSLTGVSGASKSSYTTTGIPSPNASEYHQLISATPSGARSQAVDVGQPTLRTKSAVPQKTPPVEEKKTAIGHPSSSQSTPSKGTSTSGNQDRAGIFGTLYNDLLSERHNWTSDLDFFAKVFISSHNKVIVFDELSVHNSSWKLQNIYLYRSGFSSMI
jgi:hypothetical protein